MANTNLVQTCLGEISHIAFVKHPGTNPFGKPTGNPNIDDLTWYVNTDRASNSFTDKLCGLTYPQQLEFVDVLCAEMRSGEDNLKVIKDYLDSVHNPYFPDGWSCASVDCWKCEAANSCPNCNSDRRGQSFCSVENGRCPKLPDRFGNVDGQYADIYASMYPLLHVETVDGKLSMKLQLPWEKRTRAVHFRDYGVMYYTATINGIKRTVNVYPNHCTLPCTKKACVAEMKKLVEDGPRTFRARVLPL